MPSAGGQRLLFVVEWDQIQTAAFYRDWACRRAAGTPDRKSKACLCSCCCSCWHAACFPRTHRPCLTGLQAAGVSDFHARGLRNYSRWLNRHRSQTTLCERHECCMKAQKVQGCVASFRKGVSKVDCHKAAASHSLLHRLQLFLRLPHLQRQTSRMQLGLQGVARLPHARYAPCEEV